MNSKRTSFPYSWEYSKKLAHRIEHPRFVGRFLLEEMADQSVRLVVGGAGAIEEGNRVVLYWMVDVTDGVIVDVRYQMYGGSGLIGAAEAACQLLMRKTYLQARRITTDLIDRELRDLPTKEAFPEETLSYLQAILTAIEQASDQCIDIPCEETPVDSPLHSAAETAQSYPGWELLSQQEKKTVIESVIEKEIRPYIELDQGGIQIVDLSEEGEVRILYQGACTSCHAATGSTLTAIQSILQTQVHPTLRVIPEIPSISDES